MLTMPEINYRKKSQQYSTSARDGVEEGIQRQEGNRTMTWFARSN
jgi:hypothetical protein